MSSRAFMDEDEAVQWLVKGRVWAEYHRISLLLSTRDDTRQGDLS